MRGYQFDDFTIDVNNSLGEVVIRVDDDVFVHQQIQNTLGEVNNRGNSTGNKNLYLTGRNSLGEISIKRG